jgi:hypothetical protein
MKKLEVYGHSDDGVYYRVNGEDIDQLEVRDGNITSFNLIAGPSVPEIVAKIYAFYDGCWSFTIGLVGESIMLPPWTFRIETEHAYSTKLVIECPDDIDLSVKEAFP